MDTCIMLSVLTSSRRVRDICWLWPPWWVVHKEICRWVWSWAEAQNQIRCWYCVGHQERCNLLVELNLALIKTLCKCQITQCWKWFWLYHWSFYGIDQNDDNASGKDGYEVGAFGKQREGCNRAALNRVACNRCLTRHHSAQTRASCP